MSTDQGGFLPVNTNVLVQTLVESVHAQVEERRASRELVQTPPSLQANHMLIVDKEHALDRALRISGYLARLVEVELFEPARRPADWVPEKVAEYRAHAESEDDAIAALCGDLALAEPVGKPSPDDPAAMTWRVPGPGGHVRHYLARRAIEELLRDREHPVAGDPADLKRAWVYGYLVRTCEEALAGQSTPEPAA